jgi:hypothetical protein
MFKSCGLLAIFPIRNYITQQDMMAKTDITLKVQTKEIINLNPKKGLFSELQIRVQPCLDGFLKPPLERERKYIQQTKI